MSQKKDGPKDDSHPLENIVSKERVKYDMGSTMAVAKRIIMFSIFGLFMVATYKSTRTAYVEIEKIRNAPEGPTSKFDTINTGSESSVVPSEGGFDCPVRDNHEIDGLTNVTASANVLENKDAGPLNVYVGSEMTITVQAGTFSFGPANPTPPPFTIRDMQEGFIADGSGILTIHRCN